MQSSVNNSSNNNSNSVSNVSSNTTPSAVSTKVLFIGDSRTVGMCGYTGSELYNVQTCKQHKFIGKVGIGYSYFSSNIINNIKSAVANTNDKYKIVILLGVNDLGNGVNISTVSSNYMNIITRLANNELKNHSITFVSVPPVSASNSYNIPVTNINNFNNNMKQKINSLNLNNVKYCDISTSFNASNIYQPDGLHYTSTGYTYLYNQVVNKCI